MPNEGRALENVRILKLPTFPRPKKWIGMVES